MNESNVVRSLLLLKFMRVGDDWTGRKFLEDG